MGIDLRTAMEFLFRRASRLDLKTIATWQYDPPYTQYNGRHYVPFFRLFGWLPTRFLYPNYYVADDEHGALAGFFVFWGYARGKILIGLDLRPDLTGKGHGLAFVQAGLACGKASYGSASFY